MQRPWLMGIWFQSLKILMMHVLQFLLNYIVFSSMIQFMSLTVPIWLVMYFILSNHFQFHHWACNYYVYVVSLSLVNLFLCLVLKFFVLISFSISWYHQILPPSAHAVTSTASKFLLKWLFQYEHEHKQWLVVISLGLISSCLLATDSRKIPNHHGFLKIPQMDQNVQVS